MEAMDCSNTDLEEAGGVAQLRHIDQLNESVYEFYSPPDGTSCNVEIVFLHGLEPGDYSNAYKETWTSVVDSTCCYWPQKLLPEKFPRARILSVSYDSSIRKGQKRGRLDLYCTSENLLQDLLHARVATKDRRPLVLVGKDLGGQVIKAICLRAEKDCEATFLSNLKGIVYYGTPHLGVQNLRPEYNGTLAQGLRWGDEHTSRLNNEFRVLRSRYKWAAKAILPHPGATKFGVAITEASVRNDVDGCYTTEEDMDTLCKPRARTSGSFIHLVEVIDRSLQKNADQPEMSKVKSFKPSLGFQYDRNYVPMRTTLAEVRRALQGARIVVLHGGPGSGKSGLARYLALQFQDASRVQSAGVESNSNQTACFSGGVVFLHCGDGANIATKQQELLRKFQMEILFEDQVQMNDVQFLHEKLQEISEGDRRALVVLDDIWDYALVQNLLVGGGQVKYLITTQNSTIWSGDGVEKVKIQDVSRDDARRILGNYAKFPGGVIPDNSKVKDVADKIIEAAEHHPLALATLGIVVDTGNRNSVKEWESTRTSYMEYLRDEDFRAIIFGVAYPRSTHASMMLMVDKLDTDAKSLLYSISLFAGPRIPETVVQLFLFYSRPRQGTIKNIDRSIKKLQIRGLVDHDQEPVSSWPTVLWNRSEVSHDWRVLWIHGLRQRFILTTREDDLLKIANFLQDDNEFLHLGERSNFDMAIVLCALYGAPSIKQRAWEKMGSCRH